MTPRPCPQCGKRASECGNAVLQKWKDSGSSLCPRCLRQFMGPMTVPPKPHRLCGGCGKRLKKNHPDRICTKCQKAGIIADQLSL